MKIKVLYGIIVIAFILASCQNNGGPDGSDPDNQALMIGVVDSLHSEILGENRNIWVYVPDQVPGLIYGKTDYPVLYLLDGPGHFHAVTGMLKNLGDVGIVPRMVVVGIPNTDRTRDLTPTHVDVMFGDSAFVQSSGGGAKFLDFLEKELIPYVENTYPVSNYRTLVGHSFGGLAAVYSLLSRPEVFKNYVAIDPSLRWDDWVLVHGSDSISGGLDLAGNSLYIGVANTMEEGMEIEQVLGDTARSTDHIRSILTFIKQAESGSTAKLNLGWKYYPDDDHGSVPLITEYDAFRFLFSWYRLDGLDKFFQEEAEEDVEGLMAILDNHYLEVSKQFAYQVLPPEADVNFLGYNFMNVKKPELARAMFELNIQNYPRSANVFDSMGDFCLSESDTTKAVEYFKKALDLGDSPLTRDKLNQLTSATETLAS